MRKNDIILPMARPDSESRPQQEKIALQGEYNRLIAALTASIANRDVGAINEHLNTLESFIFKSGFKLSDVSRTQADYYLTNREEIVRAAQESDQIVAQRRLAALNDRLNKIKSGGAGLLDRARRVAQERMAKSQTPEQPLEEVVNQADAAPVQDIEEDTAQRLESFTTEKKALLAKLRPFLTEVQRAVADSDFTAAEALEALRVGFYMEMSDLDLSYDLEFTNQLAEINGLLHNISTILGQLKDKAPTQEISWQSVDTSHPDELRILALFVAEANQYLADPDWDPRQVVGHSGSLTADLDQLIDNAEEIREALARSDDAVVSVRRNRQILILYINPAKEMRKKLNDRIVEIDTKLFETWKATLDQYPMLQDLVAQTARVSPAPPYTPGDTPQDRITALQSKVADATAEKKANEWLTPANHFGDLKNDYIQSLFDAATAKLAELNELIEQDAAAKELNDFNSNPIIIEIKRLLAQVPAKRQDLPRKALKQLKIDLTDEVAKASVKGLLNPSGKKASVVQAIEQLVPRIRDLLDAGGILETMLKPEVSTMSLAELADEIGDSRMDPFLWKEWKGPTGGNREREVINEFMKKANTNIEGDPKAEIDRIVYKVKVQLKTMDNQNQHENEKASTDRSQLYAEMQKRIITRRELLIATTYHPEYGAQLSEILEHVVKTASLRPDQCVVLRDGKELSILVNDLRPGETPLYEFDGEMNFFLLIGETGRTVLDRYINKVFGEGGKRYDPRALEFAQLIYTNFDYLTLSLRELQKTTQTRGHNGAVKDPDRIMFSDPLAAAVHRMFRYGGNDEDWSMWILFYHEDLRKSKFKYGKKEPLKPEAIARGVTKETAKSEDWTWPDHEAMIKLQQQMWRHERMFFEIDNFTAHRDEKTKRKSGYKENHGIPLAGYCESIGLATDAFLRLHPDETLWLFDHMIDSNRTKMVGEGLRERLAANDPINKEEEERAWRRYLLDPKDNQSYQEALAKEGLASADVIEITNHRKTKIEEERWTAYTQSPEYIANRALELAKKFDGNRESVSSIELYQLAEENGFGELLEMAYKDIPAPLTFEQIMEHYEEAGKGGLLGKWLQTAGKVKMFPGNHLTLFLEPLLTHYCLRLAQAFDDYDDPKERERLYHAMVEALSDSRNGGLSSYKAEMTAVINNLSLNPIEKIEKGNVVRIKGVKAQRSHDFAPPKLRRNKNLYEYVDSWYRKVYHEDPPQQIMGKSLEVWLKSQVLPTEKRHKIYLEMLKRHKHTKFPLTRQGTLLKLAEKDH